jgi:transposase
LTNLGTHCPLCQSYSTEIHQNRPILVRDLPCFDKVTYLRVPRRQFYCRHCQKYFTENLAWIESKRRHTLRYEENIFERVKSSSIAQVASG